MEKERINQKSASRIIQQKQNHATNTIVDNRPYTSLTSLSDLAVQRAKSEHRIQDPRSSREILYSWESKRQPFKQNVSNALKRAIIALYGVIDALKYRWNNADFADRKYVFKLSFDIENDEDLPSSREKVIGNYQKTLNGLIKNKTNFIDFTNDEVSQSGFGPQGYVNRIFGIAYGGIHINFNMKDNDLTKYIIHESTHLYAGTVDTQYFEVSDLVGPLCSHNTFPETPFDHIVKDNALNNADSYANFAMYNAGWIR